MTGVSFVVPVHNGEPWIREAIRAILEQDAAVPFEVIVVDDGSRDRSSEIVQQLRDPRLRIVSGPVRGAAAAINAGVRIASFPLIAQIDQDVVLLPGWLSRLVAEFDDPSVGAAQGYYLAAAGADLFGRAMNLDLEQRYAAIAGRDTDHVCTGNSVYRADAIRHVGLFDEGLGYGYDNDMSYRLQAAGYRLVINRDARSEHRWREGLLQYARQQYGFGYGRIDLVAKHPGRFRGDRVSPPAMMMHPLVMLAALMALGIGVAGGRIWMAIGAGLLLSLFVERLIAGVLATRRFDDPAALAFPLLHLIRDAAWAAAIVVWTARRIVGKPMTPSHSMQPRHAGARARFPMRRRVQGSRSASAPAPKRPST